MRALLSFYRDGYRSDHLDHYIGLRPLAVALSSNLPGYSTGYYDGYHRLQYQESSDGVPEPNPMPILTAALKRREAGDCGI